jgi:NADP-dependent 3-hydroxy acid dehydrogenase YdfG
MFDINVKGTLFAVQQAVPLMADGGSIILTGSVAGSKDFEAANLSVMEIARQPHAHRNQRDKADPPHRP